MAQRKWSELTRLEQNKLIDHYFYPDNDSGWAETIRDSLFEQDAITFTRAEVGEWFDQMDEECQEDFLPTKGENDGQPM